MYYYPCNQSIKILEYVNSGGFYQAAWEISKPLKPSGNCTPFPFQPLFCKNGPNTQICYASPERHFNHLMSNSNSYTIHQDSLNRQLTLEFDGISISIPTDSTNSMDLGRYEIDNSAKPIVDCYHEPEYSGPFIPFSDFSSGYLAISRSGSDYIFSWELHGCNESVWTGYVKGP